MAKAKEENYISLLEATKYCIYSQEYLSLRARQGKLKAEKFGRNWVTKEEWLEEYLAGVGEYNNKLNNKLNNLETKKEIAPPKNLPVGEPKLIPVFSRYEIFRDSVRQFAKQAVLSPSVRFGFAFGMVLVLIITGAVFGRDSLKEVMGEIGETGKEVAKALAAPVKQSFSSIFEDINNEVSKIENKIAEDEIYSAAIFGTVDVFKEYGQWLGSVSEKQFIKIKKAPSVVAVGRTSEFILQNTKKGYFVTDNFIKKEFTVFGDKVSGFSRGVSSGVHQIGNGIDQLAQKIVQPAQSFIGGMGNFSIDTIRKTRGGIRDATSNFQQIGESISRSFETVYRFVTQPWREAALIKEEVVKEEAKEETVVVKEITKEIQVSKITKVEPVKEITKEIIKTKIDDDVLVQLKNQIAEFTGWREDIKELKNITQKLQSQPAYTSAQTAPIYIASQGLQVGGSGIFASLGVSGSLGVKDLGVGSSTTLGSFSSDKLTVKANSTFESPVTIGDSLTVGSSALTINSSGNLNTTGTITSTGDITTSGDLSVTGDFIVSGAQTYSGAGGYVTTTTPQLKIGYDATNDAQFSINSSGDLTVTAYGGDISFGNENISTTGTISSATWQGVAIGAGYGGTGQTSYATGDMLYASGATTFSKLTIGTADYILTSSGTAPQWSNSLTFSDITCTDCLNATEIEDIYVFNTGDTITGFLTATAVPSGTGVSQGTLYINPASATADYTLLGVALAGVEKLKLDEDGDLSIAGDFTTTGTGTFGAIKAPTKGTASYVVAANNSPSGIKNIADYTCDGTADDVQINAALTAAGSAGGGTVFLAAGNYAISDTIKIPSNTTFAGAGNGTVLTLNDNVDKTMITNSAAYTFESRHATGNTNIVVRDMYIDGNKDGQGTGHDNIWCVGFNTVDNLVIENLTVIDGWTESIRTEFCSYVTIANNRVDNAGDDGIGINEETYYCSCYGNRITNAGQGAKTYGGPNGIEIQDSSHDVSVVANVIYNSAGDGIEVSIHTGHSSSYNVAINSNTIKNCPIGISIEGLSTSNQKAITVANNQIFNDSGVLSYGLRASYTEGLVLTGNTVRTDFVGGRLENTVTNTTISSNNFINTKAVGNEEKGFLFLSGGTFTDVRFEGNTVSNFGWKGLEIAGTVTRLYVINNNIIGCTYPAVGACVRWDSPTSTGCVLDGNNLQGTHWSYDAATTTYDVMASGWDKTLYKDITNERVGIGTIGPDAKLDILATSGAQLRLSYTDSSVYSDFTVNSSGDLAIRPTGNNLFIGYQSGNSNTTGANNIYIGYQAGYTATDDSSNVFIGNQAGYNAIVGDSTFLGYRAGYSNTTGQYNTFLGYKAGYSNTTGDSNIYIGYQAGYTATDDSNNTLIGFQAGYTNIADNNTFIGFNAGYYTATGDRNVFVGQAAGYKNDSGYYNTFIGRAAGYSNVAGNANAFIGGSAGYYNSTGNYNTYLGYGAGFTATDDSNNTFLGYQAGYSNTGSSNVFIGFQAGYNETGSNKLYIANSNTVTPLIYGDFSTGYVGIGTTSPSVKLHIAGTTTTDIGKFDIGIDLNPVTNTVAPTLSIVAEAGSVTVGTHYYYVTFYTALGETQLDPGTRPYVTIIDADHAKVLITLPVSSDYRVTGRRIYRTTAGSNYYSNVKRVAEITNNTETSYTDNIADGSLTGTNYYYQDNSTNKYITVNGTAAMIISPLNTVLGVGAGATIVAGTAMSSYNVILGNLAARALTVGANNTAIGASALYSAATGDSNVAIGYGALYSLTTGVTNVGIGRNAGYYNSGSENTLVGGYAGYGVTGWNNSYNTFIGFKTGYLIKGGGYNVLLGYQAGYNLTSGASNVFLGYNAGYRQTTNSNLLIIDNQDRTTAALEATNALIYGVFNVAPASQTLTINANVGIGINSPTAKLTIQIAATPDAHLDLNPIADAPTANVTEGDIYMDDDGILYIRSNTAWAAANAAADFSELIVPLGFEKETSPGVHHYIGEIEAGDVIVINKAGFYERSSKPYDLKVAGVESGNRGQYLLHEDSPEREEGQRQIGIVGHLLVKVTTENGPIEAGDFLTTSSLPGYAMKATEPGAVVAKALESFDNSQGETGQIEAFVNAGWYGGQLTENGSLEGGNVDGVTPEEKSFVQRIKDVLASLGLSIQDGIAQIKEIITEKITAETARVQMLEMVDQRTGDIYCTWIEYGEMKKVRGECETIDIVEPEPLPEIQGCIDSQALNYNPEATIDNDSCEYPIEEISDTTELPDIQPSLPKIPVVETNTPPIDGTE